MSNPRLRPSDSLKSVVDELVSWTASRAHPSDIVDQSDPTLGHLFVALPDIEERGERPLRSNDLAQRRRATRGE